MLIESIFELPVPSTELTEDAILCANTVRYNYLKDGIAFNSGIIFNNVKAKRTRSDEACTAWQIENSYDTLVEITDSTWIAEIMQDTEERQRRYGAPWILHHYMIYLDGTGCIEVVADLWNELAEERGSWIW